MWNVRGVRHLLKSCTSETVWRIVLILSGLKSGNLMHHFMECLNPQECMCIGNVCVLSDCRVKPAIFDLFLAVGIALYGLLWYLSVLVSETRSLHCVYCCGIDLMLALSCTITCAPFYCCYKATSIAILFSTGFLPNPNRLCLLSSFPILNPCSKDHQNWLRDLAWCHRKSINLQYLFVIIMWSINYKFIAITQLLALKEHWHELSVCDRTNSLCCTWISTTTLPCT